SISLITLACGRTPLDYLNKGRQLSAQGKIDDAKLNFQKALQRDAKLGPAYLELGTLYIKQGDNRDAYAALSSAVDLMPDNLEAKHQLADLTLSEYQSNPARPQFLYAQLEKLATQMLKDDPNSFEGRRLKGYINLFDRKPLQAAENFRKANSLEPNQPDV